MKFLLHAMHNESIITKERMNYMFYYNKDHNTYISKYSIEQLNINIKELGFNHLLDNFEAISEEEASKSGCIYALNVLHPASTRRSFCVTQCNQLFLQKEDLSILKTNNNNEALIPNWLLNYIKNIKVVSLNAAYPNWADVTLGAMPNLNSDSNKKWKVNVVGLGDVGGTLVTGLRLLGNDCISSIGIYDKDENKIKRWHFECGQILSPNLEIAPPEIEPLEESDLFNCDMFVFCVSVGVPEVGKEVQDVRLVQFKGNANIISYYAKAARKNNFKGIFAVVSDPVDLLCRAVFDASNRNESGELDYDGLSPEQIRGYGLGVMNARAAFYAKEQEATEHYLTEGRAFGPHGEGLIIADSIENYCEEFSSYLTEKTKKANLDVRSYGFKPYIAPALSSGTLSLIATIKGHWHYSANFIGGTYMGSKNRLRNCGLELETYHMPKALFSKLESTYGYLTETYKLLSK